MTTVYYALGGGRGHLQRAYNLASREPGRAMILHQAPEPARDGRVRTVPLGPCSAATAREALRNSLSGASALVVDTFPGGVGHELDLPTHVPTTLIARHLDRASYADYDELAARYDRVLLPYPPDRCEWDHPPPGRFIGPITRPIALGGEADVLVIGEGEPPSWTRLLAGATRVRGPFDRLPRARRVVALSAGYNLAWELHALGFRPAFRPLPRRFDDQFARAARLGVPLHHAADLEAFLHGSRDDDDVRDSRRPGAGSPPHPAFGPPSPGGRASEPIVARGAPPCC